MKRAVVLTWIVAILSTFSHIDAHIVMEQGGDFNIPIVHDFVRAPIQKTKEWTVLVYFAADNDLHSIPVKSIKQMLKIGSNENLNIVVFLDIKEPGKKKIARRFYVEKGHLVQRGPGFIADSGSAERLIEEAEWALKNFPSKNFGISLWNHGIGDLNPKRGICFDDTHMTYLDDKKLMKAFNKIVGYRGGKNIDVLWFDGCLMAGTGTAWIASQFADYMVASEEVIYGTGSNYGVVLEKLAKGGTDPREFVEHTVNCYGSTYGRLVKDYTLSAFDLSKFSAMSKNIDTLARLLIAALDREKNESVSSTIDTARDRRNTICFDEPSYADLFSFYYNLYIRRNDMILKTAEQTKILHEELEQLLVEGFSLLSGLVIANATGGRFAEAGGLSIFFPEHRIYGSFYGSYYATEFAKHNSWCKFLKRLYPSW